MVILTVTFERYLTVINHSAESFSTPCHLYVLECEGTHVNRVSNNLPYISESFETNMGTVLFHSRLS